MCFYISYEIRLICRRLFKPAFITSLGSFQDGGLRHNNPMDLALWECPKLWPTSTSPDVVVSLGTGMDDNTNSPKAPNFRHIFNDGFIPRLCRSFMSSLDGERTWRDLSNRLDDTSKADYFRLNVPFLGDEPRLDDVGCMGELRRSVQLQPNGLRDRSNVAFALLVASFFFELDRAPTFETGRYLCQGFIMCRNNPQAVLKSLTKLHNTRLELVTDDVSLGVLSPGDVCSMCHMYCKRVHFYVRHREDIININIKVHHLERRKISGFPHSLMWFIRQQHLDEQFGSADHDIPQSRRCRACRTFLTHSVQKAESKKRPVCPSPLEADHGDCRSGKKRKLASRLDPPKALYKRVN